MVHHAMPTPNCNTSNTWVFDPFDALDLSGWHHAGCRPVGEGTARLRLRLSGLLLLLLISQMLPPINLAVPLFVLFQYIGLVNTYPGLILADTVFVLPFAIIILRPFLLSIPGDLEDAAMVDGCSRLGAFSRIVLPLVVPGLIAVGALAFVLVWGEFILGLTLMT